MPNLIRKRHPDTDEMRWAMVSETTGHVLRWFGKKKPSKSVQMHEERRVQFFKNLSHSSGGPGSLKEKVKKKSLLQD